MKSFPSALLKGGSSLNPVTANSSAKDQIINSFLSSMNSQMSNTTTGSNLDTAGINDIETFDYRSSLDKLDFTKNLGKINIGNNALFPTGASNESNIENVFRMGNEVFSQMNNYRGYLGDVQVTLEPGDEDDDGKYEKVLQWFPNKITPSLFNPMYGLISSSITDNTPLLDTVDVNINKDADMALAENITDCSIRSLVQESRSNNPCGVLGMAKYKYADFMYCKDLGKKSNNHLITLRRYALPVGDDINRLYAYDTSKEFNDYSKDSNGVASSSNLQADNQPDIARLVTWFGTEDNKLENIMTYDVEATWKEFNSDIEDQNSQEEDSQRGYIGQFANLLSATYQKQMQDGVAMAPVFKKLFGSFGTEPSYKDNPVVNGERYDKNKIYEPINTIRSTHKYEGNLKFNQEFTLKFSYKLRAYDNINPKSAFLDLLANILVMTYRDGNFWGGTRRVIGPATNNDVWAKANALVGDGLSKANTIFNTFLAGGFDLGNLTGGLSQILESFGNSVKDFWNSNGFKESMKNIGGGLIKAFSAGMEGLVRNKLGRPSIYAFSSMLDGSNVGLWHVTIGNPKSPIASFGNMILTKAKITHSGPLGIDDFPTELTVEVSLKHARPRDASEIQKMYTRGVRNIYYAYSTYNGAKPPTTKPEYFNLGNIDSTNITKIRDQVI